MVFCVEVQPGGVRGAAASGGKSLDVVTHLSFSEVESGNNPCV